MLDKEYEVYKKASARTNRRNRGEGQYLRKITVITILSKFVCLILCFYRSLQLVNFVFYRSLKLTNALDKYLSGGGTGYARDSPLVIVCIKSLPTPTGR